MPKEISDRLEKILKELEIATGNNPAPKPGVKKNGV
jgi:hypothetical protein